MPNTVAAFSSPNALLRTFSTYPGVPRPKLVCVLMVATKSSNTKLTRSCDKSATPTIAVPKALTSLGAIKRMTSAACCSPRRSMITAARSVPDMALNSSCSGLISGFSSGTFLPFFPFCFLSLSLPFSSSFSVSLSLAMIISPIHRYAGRIIFLSTLATLPASSATNKRTKATLSS